MRTTVGGLPVGGRAVRGPGQPAGRAPHTPLVTLCESPGIAGTPRFPGWRSGAWRSGGPEACAPGEREQEEAWHADCEAVFDLLKGPDGTLPAGPDEFGRNRLGWALRLLGFNVLDQAASGLAADMLFPDLAEGEPGGAEVEGLSARLSLSRTRFLLLTRVLRDYSPMDADLREAFPLLDGNRDGVLSAVDLARFAEKYDVPLSADDVADIMEAAGVNDRGAITLDAFLGLLKRP